MAKHKPTPDQHFRIMPKHLHYTQEEENRRPIGGQFDRAVTLRRQNSCGFTEETKHYSQTSLSRAMRLGGECEVIEIE